VGKPTRFFSDGIPPTFMPHPRPILI